MIGTETLRALVALNLTPAQILAVSEAIDLDARPKDATAAERKRRQRAREAGTEDDVTRDMSRCDVTRDPPNDIYSNPPVPSSDEDGQDEVSPEVKLWSTGKELLTKLGVPKSKAGSAIGKWKRDHGVGETIDALTAADRESRLNGGLVDPIAFVEGVFRHRSSGGERPIC